jgi:hypothetical protein
MNAVALNTIIVRSTSHYVTELKWHQTSPTWRAIFYYVENTRILNVCVAVLGNPAIADLSWELDNTGLYLCETYFKCRTWGSHSDSYEHCHVPGYSAPCMLYVNRRFGRTYRLLIQGVFARLIFNLEDGGDIRLNIPQDGSVHTAKRTRKLTPLNVIYSYICNWVQSQRKTDYCGCSMIAKAFGSPA